MTAKNNLKLLLVFATAFSLAALSGPMSSSFQLPTVPLARATPQPCEVVGSSGACSERWYPAGPAMNAENFQVFTDQSAELTNLCLPTSAIDFPDVPFTPPSCFGFQVTAPVAEISYYEIEFHLANNFWNCNFGFGNSGCGVDIRQGVAHMFDKGVFCSNLVPTGTCTALDVPVPTSSGGSLPSPNPCAYDARFPQTGANCVVGALGGTAYHLKASTGANSSPWLYAPGSADLNAAATHFVDAGVATGFNNVTSVLTNAVTTTTPTFFIRSDSPARKLLGESLAAQICHLFTGSYSHPCLPFLQTVEGPISAFPGLDTSPNSVNQNWWLYTAGFSGVQFFDSSLYHTYNSRFVSGIPSIQPPNGPCSPLSVPTSNAANYMYLCSPAYDDLTNQMENSPCLTSPQDPATGQPNNGPGGHCSSDLTKLSAISAGIQAEASFGGGAFTIPVFEQTVQYEYLNGWTRVDNGVQGLPNYFTWLNAYNPSAVVPLTIRQGLSQGPRSLNPYIASTRSDLFIVGNIYDSLSILDPLATVSSVNWMTLSRTQFSNSTLTYTPPSGTFTTYRFTLWNSLFFQDGRPVTAYDVAFSYLSMVGSGASLGAGASGITGITVLGPRVFDIGLRSPGPFTLSSLTGVPILPGRYWTGAGGPAWDNAVQQCTSVSNCPTSQYTLSGSTVNCSMNCTPFSAALMTVNPADVVPTFDPGPNHVLIGSGPWQCGTVTASGSSGCYSTVSCGPGPCPASYQLTRFGNGFAPASSATNIYFRSSGNLALHIWSEENDQNPIQALSFVAVCFGQPVNLGGPCGHWQHGIGASSTGIVGINQVSIVELRFNLNWISPFEWATNPPLGIGLFPPVLYEGAVTLNPCSIDPINGYDC